MSTRPKLTKAPIVEGLIDLRSMAPNLVEMEALQAVADRFAGEYPRRERLIAAQIHIAPEAHPTSNTTQEHVGWRLTSLDERWVVQLRRDGLTVSRLEPYGAWEDLVEKTKEWWPRHREVSGSNPVTRVATRFINRVPLPANKPLEDTFQTMFKLGAGIPEVVGEYFLRIAIPFNEDNAMAVITQSLEPMPNVACILDIDVFVNRPAGLSEVETWNVLNTLHGIKNDLFFGSLTETAVRSFQ